jgi:hypothetical protein
MALFWAEGRARAACHELSRFTTPWRASRPHPDRPLRLGADRPLVSPSGDLGGEASVAERADD